MKLKTAQATMFRNILDSTRVAIDEHVTAIVGKNESGKTSFLVALSRLNPARPSGTFETNADYPAWLEKKHRQQGQDLSVVAPIRAIFAVEDSDRTAWASKLGTGVIKCNKVEASRTYGKTFYVGGWDADEPAAVAHVLKLSAVREENARSAHSATSFVELREAVAKLEGEPDAVEAAAAIRKATTDYLGNSTFEQLVLDAVAARVPKMFYFASYSSFPKKIDIRSIIQRARRNEQLSDSERTAVSLLRLAATDDEYLLNADYELRKRELENVANAITDDVLKYWTQNPDLRVLIDITQVTERSDHYHQQQSVLDELKLRVWDDRHRLSLGFSGRSSGFQWFFSFLSAFSEYEASNEPLVILLDEPALGLHARAQADFLRFIDDRLAVKHQVIYTTHSPFMVPPSRLDRVRVVEDAGRESGSRISADVLATDPDTLFPLQGALGYDLVQHLFVAPDNLVVEGTSDFTYLSLLSEQLLALGRVGLDPRWSVVPVGGADLVPTFVALLGHHLGVTVLVDSQRAGHQKLNRLATEGLLEKRRILTVGGVLGKPLADIEDAFDIDDYLVLYNGAFSASLTAPVLTGTDPIVARIARNVGVDRFDHGRPAEYLLRQRAALLPTLKPATLDQFEQLFKAVNATLPPKA